MPSVDRTSLQRNAAEVTFHVRWVLEAFHVRFPGQRNDPRKEAPHRTREKTSGTQGTFLDDHSVKGTMTRFCACAAP